jgi:uncharacterized membrane protein YgdD (TMEM256/DUF423 family)
MHRNFIKTAAFSGALCVLLGAFGAHTLKQYLEPEILSSFQTGVTYQFYHTFALLSLGILLKRYPGKWLERSGLLFIAGTILFSGSLYLLTALKATNEVGLGGFGLITPIGGILLVGGWISMFLGIPAVRKTESKSDH